MLDTTAARSSFGATSVNSDGSVAVPSASRPGIAYRVTFEVSPSGLVHFFCTCPAGMYRWGRLAVPCRHARAAGAELEVHGLVTATADSWWLRHDDTMTTDTTTRRHDDTAPGEGVSGPPPPRPGAVSHRAMPPIHRLFAGWYFVTLDGGDLEYDMARDDAPDSPDRRRWFVRELHRDQPGKPIRVARKSGPLASLAEAKQVLASWLSGESAT